MFSIGDSVVHPMHGAGVIDAIVQEKIEGNTQNYYVFKMPLGGLLLKIPTANTQMIGIRSIIQPEEAEALLTAIPDMTVEVNSNWNKRYQENLTRIKSGDLYEVARVVKSLSQREGRRGLSTGERKMLHTARQIMVSELAMVEHLDYADAEAKLDQAIAKTPAVCGKS